MKTLFWIAMTLTMIAGGMLAAQQSPNGTVQGTIFRAGSQDPVSNVTVSLLPAQSQQAFDALTKAGEGLVLPGLQQALPELLTMTTDDLKGAMNDVRSMSLPPAFTAAFSQFQTARESAPGFPKHVLSDNAGHFTFTDVPAGRYSVIAQREGFFGKPVDGSNDLRDFESAPAAVAPQQTTSDIAITLYAGATISGRVMDEGGKPLSDINVQALSISYQNGLPVLQIAVANRTDDRGVFRLYYLPPDDYLIGAAPPNVNGTNAAAVATGPEVVVKTFYPNIITPLMATPVSVRLGDETAGIDIHMRTVRTAKITGTVVNQLGAPRSNPDGTPGTFPNAQLQILQHDNSVPDDTGARVVGSVSMANQTGSFTINGILPGIYDLYARITDPRGSQGQGGMSNAWGRAIVEVRDKDIEGVTMTVHPSVEVKGRLTVNGNFPTGASNSIKVGLQPDGSSSKLPNYQGVQGRAQVPGANGEFTIPGVAEGAYRVQVLGLPGNAYVDEIRQGGRFVFDSGIVVGDRTPDEIEVAVNSNGGTIEGDVTTTDRKLSISSTVVLFPDAPHRENPALYKTATTDLQGHFAIHGIHPGTYRLLAWENVPQGAYMNPAFLSKFEARGYPVNVTQQSSNTVALTVIPKN